MRVGIFGGSFNPIHFGHLRAAEEVREMLKLDLVYFVPASSPPHKPEGELAPAEHRLQMVRLATKGNRHFMVSDAEVRRAGRSYTIDTAKHFSDDAAASGADFHPDGIGSVPRAGDLEGLRRAGEAMQHRSAYAAARRRDGGEAFRLPL